MRVMRLRERLDLALRNARPEHATQVLDDHLAPDRQQAIQQPPEQRRARRRGQRQGDRRRGRGRVRQRDGDGARCVPAQHRARAIRRNDDRGAVGVAGDREIVRIELAERRLARKQLLAGLLRCEARGEARCASRALAGVGELLRGEKIRRGLRPASPSASARCARSRRCRSRSGRRLVALVDTRHASAGCAQKHGRVRAAEAAADDEHDIARRLLRRLARATRLRRPDRASSSVAMPGHDAAACRLEAQRQVEDAGRRERMPGRPLERGHRRRGARRRPRATPQPPIASDCGVPLPCATIMPTSDGRDARIVERSPDRARRALAVLAEREQAHGLRTRRRRPGTRRGPSRRARARKLRSRAPARPRLRRAGCRRATRRTA